MYPLARIILLVVTVALVGVTAEFVRYALSLSFFTQSCQLLLPPP